MRKIVRWAIQNSPAMNVMLIAALLVGSVSLIVMRREVFPEFELEILLVSVPYPGASPEEVETGICLKLEEALRNLDGVKKMTSVAREGAGFVVIELKTSVKDVQKTLNECRSEIEQIPELPRNAEKYNVQQITFKFPAIAVGIIAPENSELDDFTRERHLRELADEIRDEILALRPTTPKNPVRAMFAPMIAAPNQPAISSAYIVAARNYQIDVEVSEDQLREYGLSIDQISRIIQMQNTEIPGGTMETESQELRLRGNRKRMTGHELEKIVVMAQKNGDALTLDKVANVKDGFLDSTSEHFINGRRGMVVVAQRTANEDLFSVVETVRDYVADKKVPPGYELKIWGDTSLDVRDRIELLTRNGLQGLILVFIVLAIFLDLRLSFWVALGIPVSILGAGFVLILLGQTLNMLSMFAFLMALGIVVDDAIVIGENIYKKREQGLPYVRAAIEGTVEVIPSVTASVTTTIIAFAPLMFVSGVMGKFIAVMPIAVIAMLIISLIESAFILPCHLAHDNNLFLRVVGNVLYIFKPIVWLVHKIHLAADRVMRWKIEKIYAPMLNWSLYHKSIVLATAATIFLITVGFNLSGLVPFEFFPKLDGRQVNATVIYPDGTSSKFSNQGTLELEAAIKRVQAKIKEERGEDVIEIVYRRTGEVGQVGMGPTGVTNGSHVGTVEVDLVSTAQRTLTSQQILNMWREEVGEIAGTDSIKFGSASMGPGGAKIEFKLLAASRYAKKLEEAVEECKEYLRGKVGVYDIEDDMREGKIEVIFTLNEKGKALNLDENMLSQNIRNNFYGAEVQRVQRGRNEVKIMVRYPESERKSFKGFAEVRIRDNDGNAHPLTEVANIEMSRAPAEINRINGYRSITVVADVKKEEANARAIVMEMKTKFIPELQEKYKEQFDTTLYVDWEGEAQQSQDAFFSMFVGFFIAMFCMYCLLTLAFRSYVQPLIILAIIPFGYVGAVLGHWIMGIEVTLFSIFGLIALAGVIVNDSIVLVDFINRNAREYPNIHQALIAAGKRRFRPIMLTSFTTVAGLFPIMLERSFQAQVLIPMAASIVFGLLTGTILILILVPVFYKVYVSFYEFTTGMKFHISDEVEEQEAPLEITDETTDVDQPDSESVEPVTI